MKRLKGMTKFIVALIVVVLVIMFYAENTNYSFDNKKTIVNVKKYVEVK